MVNNVLQLKYTDEKIKDALKQWNYAKDKPPQLASINSRIVKPEQSPSDIGSSFIVHKVYSLLPCINIINHYYLVIDGKVWHPGYVEDPEIYLDYDTETDSVIYCIEEVCHYCVYHIMKRNFLQDKNFNIVTNNCQRITGHLTETAISMVFVFCLVGGIFTGKMMFLLFAILCIFIVLIFNKHGKQQKSLYIAHCQHVRKI